MRNVSLILATDLKALSIIVFWASLSETKSILLLRSAVDWGGLEYNLVCQLQSALTQEVFVQENAGFYEKR